MQRHKKPHLSPFYFKKYPGYFLKFFLGHPNPIFFVEKVPWLLFRIWQTDHPTPQSTFDHMFHQKIT